MVDCRQASNTQSQKFSETSSNIKTFSVINQALNFNLGKLGIFYGEGNYNVESL